VVINGNFPKSISRRGKSSFKNFYLRIFFLFLQGIKLSVEETEKYSVEYYTKEIGRNVRKLR